MSDIKIGADPEFFLRDTETGNLVSAYGMIEGTKHDPVKVECGAIQVDGMALEFNIDPASTWQEFNHNIEAVLRQLRERIDKRYKFEFIPVADFGKEYIDQQPEEAKLLGCDPDYNAWLHAINPKPNGDLGFRTASGHIHIGWTNEQDITHPEHIEAAEMMAKQLDIFVGLPSLIWDQDTRRRQMYGQFGVYRPKHYGMEYRTLSNVWVENPNLRKSVFSQAKYAVDNLLSGTQFYNSVNPHNIDRSMTSMRDLGYWVGASVPLASGQSYLVQLLNTARGSRHHAIDWSTKASSGDFFYHRTTYELRPWEEITSEDTHGDWTSPNAYAIKSKRLGLTKCVNEVQYREAANAKKAAEAAIFDGFIDLAKMPPRKRVKKLTEVNLNWAPGEPLAVAVDPFEE